MGKDELYAEATDLSHEARSLEAKKDLELRLGAEWEEELRRRQSNVYEAPSSLQEAKVNRDWHLQQADAYRKQIKKLRNRIHRLVVRAHRVLKRRK